MRSARIGALLFGSILVLAACGRVPATSSATESPSASAASSSAAAPTPLTIPGPTLHMGEVDLAYAPVNYLASGGTAPYTWWVSAGALPGGLTISTDGAISGTPAASGTFNFTVAVNDAGMATANLRGSISIAPRLIVSYVGEMASKGNVSVCTGGGYRGCWTNTPDNRYAPFATVSGGAPPYKYSVVSGTTPPGTKLNGLALAGTIPDDTEGSYRFSVAVTDSLGATVTLVAEYDLWFHRNFPPPSP